MCYRFLAFPLSYSKHGQSVYVLFLCVFENGCACKYFLPGAACSGVVERERERETVGTHSGVKLFSRMGAR